MASRLASESKPTLTMPRKRLPLASPTSIRRLSPASRAATACLGVVGDAEHPGEVVAAAAGDDPQRRLGAGHRAADRADQAVAADHHRHLAGFDRPQRLLDAVLEPWCAGPGRRRGARRAPARPAAAASACLPPAEDGLTSSASGIPSMSMRSQPIRRRAAHRRRAGARQRSCRRRPRRSRAARRRARARRQRASRPAGARQRLGAAGAGEDQVAAGPQDPGDLGRPLGAASTCDDEVEVVVGVGKVAGRALLEGDPALRVEPDPGRRRARPRSAERSTPRTRAAGNSRARKRAPSPSPHSISSTRSGAGATCSDGGREGGQRWRPTSARS